MQRSMYTMNKSSVKSKRKGQFLSGILALL